VTFQQTAAGAEIFPVLCSYWLCGHASGPNAYCLGLKLSCVKLSTHLFSSAWCLMNFSGNFIFYT